MIGFVVGLAIWFLVIMPAIMRFATNTDDSATREYIEKKLEEEQKYAEIQAEIRWLEMRNEALRQAHECQQADEATRRAWNYHMNQERCCWCWENPNCSGFVRNAGTVEVVREMKALPEGSQND